MQKLRSISLFRLLKYELPDLAERVIMVIDDHDPELLKINDAFELLVKQQSNIDILKLEYGPHVITPELGVLRKQRATYAAVISLHTRALSRYVIEGDDRKIQSVRLLVNLYLKNVSRFNEKIIHQKLSEFFRKIDEEEVLEITFSEMGLTTYLNDLRNVHSAIDEYVGMRDSSIASRPSISIPPIAKAVRRALRNMFLQITTAQDENKDLDYSLLISELNQKIVHFTSLISMRSTIREKKKAEAENADGGNVVIEEGTGETETPEDATPESSQRMMNLNVEDVDDKGIISNPLLNKEKTAAKSSKNSQLPSIDDDEIVS